MTNYYTPRKSINKAYLKVKPIRSDIEKFKVNLGKLLQAVDDGQKEEHQKTLFRDFFKDTYYGEDYYFNTKGDIDWVINNGKSAHDNVGVLFEVKRTTNSAEMLSHDKINTKALQELLLYYLRERITEKNLEIKNIVVTNINEWFIFDANVFEKAFAQDSKLIKLFKEFELEKKDTGYFYSEIAKQYIDKHIDSLVYTYVDIAEYKKFVKKDEDGDNKLIPLYKLFSPEHLLKKPFLNDSNSLNKNFYSELLHIIGLEEVKDGTKKLIGRRAEGKRDSGSLLEKAILIIKSRDKLNVIKNVLHYGKTADEQLHSIAMELVITWINRILFLKLLEAQLIKYNKGDRAFAFLNADKVQSFDELDALFFQVLAVRVSERDESVKSKFSYVPYLNSSLFELTSLEHESITIASVSENSTLPLPSNTVLKNEQGKKRTGEMHTLNYIFEFLNAYDFTSEGGEEIQEDNKALINASVLGLIFEKINGYKEGSFFTPSFVTMYMCREAITKAVIQKFNKVKGWNCASLIDLGNEISDKKEANDIINNIRICDPAVGSGHFLVSALNELIYIKSELKILQDKEGRILKDYTIDVVNDELIVTDYDGEFVEYHPKNKESQRLQETIFEEKKIIIENCLFGADINQNAVKICRLRLWIELLKNAYYKINDELETLPNIDINIKCGNSLISRFALDIDLKEAFKKNKLSIKEYRKAVQAYKNANSKQEKREMEEWIDSAKTNFRTEIAHCDPKAKKLENLRAELKVLELPQTLLGETKAEERKRNKDRDNVKIKFENLNAEIEEIKNNKIYEDALEWRFEFPEVLNDDGEFVGFDLVIANPPYVVLSSFADVEFKYLQNAYKTAYGRINTFAIFAERVTQLLSKSARCTLIIPDSLCNIDYYMDLRKYLLDNFSISEIIELGDGVFDEAVVPAIIFSFTNSTVSDNQILIGDKQALFGADKKAIPQKYYLHTPKYSFNLHSDELFFKVQSLINNTDVFALKDVAEIKIGICTGNNNKHMANSPIFANSKKVLQGRDINRYSLAYNNLYVNYDKKELLRARDEGIFLYDEKLLMRQTSDKLILTYDNNKFYTIDSLFIIHSTKISLKYLLALLNSKLLNRQYQKLNPEQGRVFAQVKIDYVNELPIVVNGSYVETLVKLVDRALDEKAKDVNSDVSAIEEEIDKIVYDMYGLTDAEREAVEG